MQIARRLNFISHTSGRVLTEISNFVSRSNTRCRVRSFAASVSSDTPKVRKVRKVHKDERQAMVESLVNTYRDRNSGKFPTPTYVRKEVGGSYYNVRKIVQELEFKSKLSSSKTGNETSSGKELAKKNEASTKLKENSSSQMTLDVEIHKDGPTVAIGGMETSDSNRMHFEVKEGSQVSILVKNTLSEQVTTPTDTTGDDYKYVSSDSHFPAVEVEEISYSYPKKPENIKEEKPCEPVLQIDGSKSKAEEHQPSPENPFPKKPENVKEETPCESVLDIDGSKIEAEEDQSSPEFKKFARDLTENQTEEKIQNKASIWGNLKSVAEGIINIWRKR